MSVIFVLMGFGVFVAGSFLIAFLWAVRTGQFEDRHTPAMRILFDDEKPRQAGSTPEGRGREKSEELVLRSS